jgi:hypothetical protein
MPETWTLARIRAANEAAGYDLFGHQERCGCPFESHAIHLIDDRIWIEQLEPTWQANGNGRKRRYREIGCFREFFPETGFISSVIRFHGDEADRRPVAAA